MDQAAVHSTVNRSAIRTRLAPTTERLLWCDLEIADYCSEGCQTDAVACACSSRNGRLAVTEADRLRCAHLRRPISRRRAAASTHCGCGRWPDGASASRPNVGRLNARAGFPKADFVGGRAGGKYSWASDLSSGYRNLFASADCLAIERVQRFSLMPNASSGSRRLDCR